MTTPLRVSSILMSSENSTGTFKAEDVFTITGRGIVLAGRLLTGQVSADSQLLLANGTRWPIKAVEAINTNRPGGIVGLLLAEPGPSRQEVLASGIIGDIAQLLAP